MDKQSKQAQNEQTDVIMVPEHVTATATALLTAKEAATSAFGAVVGSIVAYVDDGASLDDAATGFKEALEADLWERLEATGMDVDGFTFGAKGSKEVAAKHSVEARHIVSVALSARATISRAKGAIAPTLTKQGKVGAKGRKHIQGIVEGTVTVRAAKTKTKGASGKLTKSQAEAEAAKVIKRAQDALAAIVQRMPKGQRAEARATFSAALAKAVKAAKAAKAETLTK